MVHPLSQLSPFPPLSQTWNRLLHLDTLVDLSSTTLWQYNPMSLQSLYTSYLDSINYPSIRGDGTVSLVTEEELVTEGGDGTVALVTEEELEPPPYFCDYYSSMEAMDLFGLSLTPTPVPNGIFDMSDCCLPEATV